MVRTASCHCGQLRLIASGEPERVGICNCRACQRRTGSAVPRNAYYLRINVHIEGQTKRFERVADSGRGRKVCATSAHCGSTVYWEGDIYPTIYGIAVGAFADSSFPAPTFSIFEEVKQPRPQMDSIADHYQRGRIQT